MKYETRIGLAIAQMLAVLLVCVAAMAVWTRPGHRTADKGSKPQESPPITQLSAQQIPPMYRAVIPNRENIPTHGVLPHHLHPRE